MKKFLVAMFFTLGIIPNFNGNLNLITEVQAQMMAYEWPGEDDCYGGDTGLGYGHCGICDGCYDARYDSCPWCGGIDDQDQLKDYDKCIYCNKLYKISKGHKCTYQFCLDCKEYFDPFYTRSYIKHLGHRTIVPRY